MGEERSNIELRSLEARVEQLERVAQQYTKDETAEAAAARDALVMRVSRETNLPAQDVEKVLYQLGLTGLQRNLAETASPRSLLDSGRLVLMLVSNRQIIAA